MSSNVKVSDVGKSLVWIWGIGFLIVFALLFVMTAAGTFEGYVQQAWAWFLPTMLPTLSLAVVSSVLQRGKGRSKVVSSFVAQLAKVVSLIYVALVLVSILAWPVTGTGPLTWFKVSGLWLGPIQGAVSAVLATFLTGQKDGS